MQELDSSLAIGSQVGDYRIIDILGAGGFGITYKAEDTVMRRMVALKEFLPQELAGRSQDASTVIPKTNCSDDYSYGLDKFLNEARTLAKFNHPNIVKAYTLVQANGTAYLVMEYVEGEALDEHLKKIHFNGNMAESRIREIIEPLLKGLAVVHKAGLLHRDIKPGNIYLQSSSDNNEHNNNPMLIDFGAARQSVGEKSKSISAIISQGYAPPEQYTSRGKQGPYTDIYAIGAVMYYLATGNKPVESTDRQHDIMEGETDPLLPIESEQFSQEFKQAINQAMVLVVKKRCQNVEHLQKILAGEQVVLAENLATDEDATRKVSSQEKPTQLPPQTSQALNSEVEKSKSSTNKVVPILVVVILSVAGYFGFGQYQEQQARIQAEQKQAKDKAAQQKQAALTLKKQEQEQKDRLEKEKIAKQEVEQQRLSTQRNKVLTIQQGLQELGFQSPTHGEVDIRTEKAIEAFEKQQGMLVTGAADDILLKALKDAVDAKLLKDKRAREKQAAKEKAAKEKAIAEQKAADKLAAEVALKQKQERDRLAAIEASKVNINVSVSPSDANVIIERNGTFYKNKSRILPGSYQITVKKEGHQSQKHLVEVTKSNHALSYQLKEYSESVMELPNLTKGDFWEYTMDGVTQTSARVVGEDVYKGKPAVVLESAVVMPLPKSLRNDAGIKAMSRTSIVDSNNNTFTSKTKMLLDKNSLEAFKMVSGLAADNPTEMDMDGRIVKGEKWPLKVGNKWESSSRNMTTYNEVTAIELVKVPAGEFYCFKIVSLTEGEGFNMRLTNWFSAEVKYIVKYEIATYWTNKSLNIEDSVKTSVLTKFSVNN